MGPVGEPWIDLLLQQRMPSLCQVRQLDHESMQPKDPPTPFLMHKYKNNLFLIILLGCLSYSKVHPFPGNTVMSGHRH